MDKKEYLERMGECLDSLNWIQHNREMEMAAGHSACLGTGALDENLESLFGSSPVYNYRVQTGAQEKNDMRSVNILTLLLR